MRIKKKETQLTKFTYYTPIYTPSRILFESTIKKIIHSPNFVSTKNTIWIYYANKYYTIYCNKNYITTPPPINIIIHKITNITHMYSLDTKHLIIIHKQKKIKYIWQKI